MENQSKKDVRVISKADADRKHYGVLLDYKQEIEDSHILPESTFIKLTTGSRLVIERPSNFIAKIRQRLGRHYFHYHPIIAVNKDASIEVFYDDYLPLAEKIKEIIAKMN